MRLINLRNKPLAGGAGTSLRPGRNLAWMAVALMAVLLLPPAELVFADSQLPGPQKARRKMSEMMPKELLSRKPAVPPSGLQNLYTSQKITDGATMDFSPEFSPDGNNIVFISRHDVSDKIEKGEFWHKSPFYLNLWLMGSDGKNRRQLTSGDAFDLAPRFTATGE